MSITAETRRASYEEIKPNLSKRQSDIVQELANFPDGATAGELAMYMWEKNFVPLPDRNSVHPRLHELVNLSMVEIDSKRPCKVSGKACAVYKLK